MAIRITQQYMYGNMVSGMQSSLGNYMETIEQGSSQKKVNRPSDDPAAFYRILTTRDGISETKKYMTNINEAKGWLELTDSTMSSLTTLMQSIKALMNQGSTNCTASERQIMADEAWQMFGQILNLSNTEFNGNQLFAGHKYNKSAFQKGLAISVSMMDDLKPGDDEYADSAKKKWTDAISQAQISVKGSSNKTIAVQFLEKGTLDENGFHVDNGSDTNGDGKLAFRWSADGGQTWQTAALDDGATKITVGSGVEIDFTELVNDRGISVTTPGAATGPTVTVKDVSRDTQVRFDTDIDLTAPNTSFSYSYSTDGGATWQQTTATTTGNQTLELSIPGVGSIEVDASDPAITPANTVEAGTKITVKPAWDIEAAEKTANGEFNTEDGTAFFVKPTGVYQGDTNNPPPQISVSSDGLSIEAEGVFGSNVLVRFEGAKQADGTFSGGIDLTGNGEFAYSYSTDNGATWVTASAQATGNQPLRLPVPGGFIDVNAADAATANTVEAGTQVLIHPQRADLGYEVLRNTYIDVNRVGTEIFGGYYENKPTLSEETNLFNIMGDFIAALEFNNQEGCQEAYAKLSSCLEYVTTQSSHTGALENRVSLAYDVNTSTLLSQEEVLSGTEDIDLTELLTKMTQQQMAYQTVLKSSSMIMNLGLMNYL